MFSPAAAAAAAVVIATEKREREGGREAERDFFHRLRRCRATIIPGSFGRECAQGEGEKWDRERRGLGLCAY